MAKCKGKPENLKSWKPGQSGNPAGRKPGSINRSTIIKYWLEMAGNNGTVADDVALSLIKKAKDGDVNAIREAFDSAYGKLTEKKEVEAKHDVTVHGLPETADFLKRVTSK